MLLSLSDCPWCHYGIIMQLQPNRNMEKQAGGFMCFTSTETENKEQQIRDEDFAAFILKLC